MKRKMNLAAAIEFVPDDLPDGAFWAMAHEIAGADYGEAWGEINQKPKFFREKEKLARMIECPYCSKKFVTQDDRRQHITQLRRNKVKSHEKPNR